MSAYLTLLSRAQALPRRLRKDEAVLGILSDALGAILALEGPPPFPLEGSFDWKVVRTHPASGKVGSPRFVASTWQTGAWTCLLLMTPSVPMGRGFELKLKDGSTTTTPHDSASGTAMSYIEHAVRQFEMKCHGHAVLLHNAGKHRSFLAWRPMDEWERLDTSVPGDVDNYLKTVADALSVRDYRVFRNDKDIGRMIGSKLLYEGWDRPMDELLPALLSEEITALQKEGLDLEEIHAKTGMSFKALGAFLPEANRRIRKSGKRKSRAAEVTVEEAGSIAKGIEMLMANPALRVPDVAVRVQVGSKPLRAALTAKLLPVARKALVEDGATLKDAAAIARMSSPGLKEALRNDPAAIAAIAARKQEHKVALAGLGIAARERIREKIDAGELIVAKPKTQAKRKEDAAAKPKKNATTTPKE